MCTKVGQEQPVLSVACLLAGFCVGARNRVAGGRAVSDVELQHLQTLIAVRLSTSITLGIYALSKDPLNEYLKLHAVPARMALSAILGIETDAFRVMLQQIQFEVLSMQAAEMALPSVVAVSKCYTPVQKPYTATADTETVTFVTANKKKLEEVRAILGDGFTFNVVSRKVDLPELQGDPEYVSREKCRLAAEEVSTV